MYLKKEGKKEMKRGYGKEEYCDKQVYFLHKIMTKNKNNNNNNTAIDGDDDQGRNQDSN